MPMEMEVSIFDENLEKPSRSAYYGTSGYRSKDSDMNNIICRASLMAYLRSATLAGKIIGVVITASHNPIEYNGIKIIDHDGDMFDETWEKYSDELVNCENKDILKRMKRILRSSSNLNDLKEAKGHVVLGRDTRESGVLLCENIKHVLGKFGCKVDDYGIVTTPELHFLVRKCNVEGRVVGKEEYIKNLAKNFSLLYTILGKNFKMRVDTANGVVEQKLKELNSALQGQLRYEILNESSGVLNLDCGADFVKSTRKAPKLKVFGPRFSMRSDEICASFDGDADRLIFFTNPKNMEIFDGDSQAVFLALNIKTLLEKINSRAEVGVVLSYYSNNAAVDALPLESFKVVMAQTGVKNFVREARTFDVGVYFEPNGHGSVCFSQACMDEIDSGNTEYHKILRVFTELFDPCVGDAIANLLIFKVLMETSGDLRKFKENPSKLMAVNVLDKNSIKVDQKNQVLEPKGLQEKIDMEALDYHGRSFVRPSGTEDVVRIYAECPKEADADQLCVNVSQHVYDMCGGVGNHPEIDYTK